jgi:hypothetical protein
VTTVEFDHSSAGAPEVTTYFGVVLMKLAKGSRSDVGQWAAQSS